MNNQRTIVNSAQMNCVADGACKQWEITLYKDGTCTTRWGKINGTLQEKTFEDAGEAFYNKKIAEKIRKEYYFV